MDCLELLRGMDLDFQDPIGLLREVLPMVLAVVVALAVAQWLSSDKSKCEAKIYSAPHSGHAELKLCGPDVPTLTFFGDQFERFVEEVRRIYAVDHSKPPFGSGAFDANDFVPPCDIRESIRQMRAACADLQEAATGNWRLHEPIDDVCFARNLIAVDFHHARAVQLVRNYVAFRQQHRGGIFPDYSWLKLQIAVVPFEDVMGRPVMLARAKHFDPQTSAETFRSFYRGMVDSIIAYLLTKRRARLDDTNPLEQYVLVLDVLGASRKNFVMTAIKIMLQEANSYYPDRVAQIFVLGVNMAVRSLWSIVSPMVQPRTRKKTQLIIADEVPALMLRLVGENLPADYGGPAPSLPGPAEAQTAAEMAGRLAASTWESLGALRVLEEKKALASRICVAWHMPPFGFRERSSFKLWLQSRGESTAITRDTAECAEFLTDLQHSSDLNEADLDLAIPSWNEGCWSSWLSCNGRVWASEEELRSWRATRCPEVYGQVLGKILADSEGAAGRAVLDFVSGSGPYGVRPLRY